MQQHHLSFYSFDAADESVIAVRRCAAQLPGIRLLFSRRESPLRPLTYLRRHDERLERYTLHDMGWRSLVASGPNWSERRFPPDGRHLAPIWWEICHFIYPSMASRIHSSSPLQRGYFQLHGNFRGLSILSFQLIFFTSPESS